MPNYAMPRWVNPQLPTHQGMPAFFLFYITLHLRIYEDMCGGMERLIFFLNFPPEIPSFVKSGLIFLCVFFLFFAFSLSLILSKFIGTTWSTHAYFAREHFSGHSCYQTHHSDETRPFPQGAGRAFRESSI